MAQACRRVFAASAYDSAHTLFTARFCRMLFIVCLSSHIFNESAAYVESPCNFRRIPSSCGNCNIHIGKMAHIRPHRDFERNPFEARLHHPSKNQNQRFFPPNIASPSSSFPKKHSAKISIKVFHGYFPFKRSTFPAKQKTAQAQNLGFPEAPAKNSEIYVDPRRRHIVYYKALKRRDDRVADCA